MATSNTTSISIDIDAGKKKYNKIYYTLKAFKTKKYYNYEKVLKIFHFYLLKEFFI
jgi:hypothetical protein